MKRTLVITTPLNIIVKQSRGHAANRIINLQQHIHKLQRRNQNSAPEVRTTTHVPKMKRKIIKRGIFEHQQLQEGLLMLEKWS